MIKKTGEILRKRNLEKSYFVLYCMEADMYFLDVHWKVKRNM